jgi:hypothetical protein
MVISRFVRIQMDGPGGEGGPGGPKVVGPPGWLGAKKTEF